MNRRTKGRNQQVSDFDYDATDVKEGEFVLIPDGEYVLEILEVAHKKTRNGDDMAVVDFVVPDGRRIRFHNVTFLPADRNGAGMAVHFLKCLGEPHEGKVNVNLRNWIGKKLLGTVTSEQGKNGKWYNKVASVSAYQNVGTESPNPVSDDDIPF